MGVVAAVVQAPFQRRQLYRLRLRVEVEVDAQYVAITQAPAGGQCLVAQHVGAQGAGAGQVRDDVAPAQVEQLLIQAVPAGQHFLVLQPGGFEGGFGIGVGDSLALPQVGEGAETGELTAPAFAHGIGQFIVEVGEEQERLAAAVVVAHEQQWDHRRQQ